MIHSKSLPYKGLITTLLIFLLAGCTGLNLGGSSQSEGTNTGQSYFPTKFRDFEVPNELKLDSSKTLIINTSSFNGGIVALEGRLEVDSLTEYFNQSMERNGWKLTGEAHYKNVLLAFTKANKNCMITIYEGTLGTTTKVFAYMAEELIAGGGASSY